MPDNQPKRIAYSESAPRNCLGTGLLLQARKSALGAVMLLKGI